MVKSMGTQTESSHDNEEPPHKMAMGSLSESELINLCSPNIDIDQPMVSTSTHECTGYVPYTFVLDLAQIDRLRRLSILPCYPTTSHDAEHFHLLLANVSADQLTAEELARRSSDACEPPFELVNVNYELPSFYFDRYKKFLGKWTELWRMDLAILNYNYVRLLKCANTLVDEQMRRFQLRPNEVKLLGEEEYAIALDFYLQIDVDMFFMRTCTYRHARPRSPQEGLFCVGQPEARYEWTACGNCTLCYPRYEYTLRSHPAVKFGP